MSDNFVKRNLKRKSSFQYKKQRVAQKTQQANRDSDFDEGESSSKLHNNGGSSRESVTVKEGGGLNSWGVDPLTLSLDFLQRLPKATVEAKAPPTAATGTEEDTGKTIRGLNVSDGKVIDKKKLLDVAFLHDSRKYSNEALTLLQQLAPKCNGHQMPARLLTVNKSGNNKGRRFYGCTYPTDQRCKFFLWAEDNPKLLELKFGTSQKLSSAEASAVSTGIPQLSPFDYAFQQYAIRIRKASKDQIVAETKQFNKRMQHLKTGTNHLYIAVNNKYAPRKSLTVSGSKEELIKRILSEAKWWLSKHFGISDTKQIWFQKESTDYGSEEEGDCAIVESESDKDESDDDDDDYGSGHRCSKEKQENENENENEEIQSCDVISLSDTSEDDSSIEFSEEDEDEEEACPVWRTETSLNSSTLINQMASWYFGHTSLRQGQSWAIERAMQGKHSLLVMPTGFGKSLCYMLPSLKLSGLIIVVSPLIALMNDQLLKLPPELPGACFSAGLSTSQSADLSNAILNGLIKVLYVSPERLCSTAFRTLMRMLREKNNGLSKAAVTLLCVDEAHCLSQWSYNFRPAFLRIRREIKSIQPAAILALTATASESVQQDICKHLSISADGVMIVRHPRNNLQLYAISDVVSYDEKQTKVLELLQNDNKAASKSKSEVAPLTIIYVWKRTEAEALGSYLKASGVAAVVYHGGMDSQQRDLVQRQFDRGSARCIVATIAFGMGVDKSDVRRIIHTSLPKSLENYMQEIGRAGRDGATSTCSLLFSPTDAINQHSLVQSTRLSKLQILATLLELFPYQAVADNKHNQHTVESPFRPISLSFDHYEKKIDVNPATLETLLTILELPPFKMLMVDRQHLDKIEGRFRIPEDKLVSLQKMDILVSAIMKVGFLHEDTIEEEMSKSENLSFFEEHDTTNDISLRNSNHGRNQFSPKQFLCRRSHLAEICALDLDEVSRGLYMLQQRGILEYHLSENSTHVLVAKNTALESARVSRNTSLYWTSVMELTEKLHSRIEDITDQNGNSVLKMWKIANIIATTNASKQQDLQAFLDEVLHDKASKDAETSLIDLHLAYEQVVSPFQQLRRSNVTGAYEKKLPSGMNGLLEVIKSIRVIVKEPSLLLYCNRLLNDCLQKFDDVSLKTKLAETLAGYRSDMVAQYCSRAMHGLSTSTFLPFSLWSQGMYNDIFGQFKQYNFLEIYQEVRMILSKAVSNE